MEPSVSRLSQLALLALGLSAFGCSPSPQKVCDQITKLEEDDEKDKDKKKKDDDEFDKLIKKIRAERRERCPKELGALKEDSGDVYKCFSKCVMDAKDKDDAQKCQKSCDGFKAAIKKAVKKVKADKKDDDDDKGKDKDKDKKKSKDDDD